MSKGMKVAKPNHDIKDSSEFIYVDTTTPLFKVHKIGTGKLISNGGDRVVTWGGDGEGSTQLSPISFVGDSYTLKFAHGLGYTPFFMAFADALPGSDRIQLTSIGVTSELPGGIYWFASADADNITLTGQSNNTDVSFNYLAPSAGEYDFLIYVFNNSITPDKVRPKL